MVYQFDTPGPAIFPIRAKDSKIARANDTGKGTCNSRRQIFHPVIFRFTIRFAKCSLAVLGNFAETVFTTPFVKLVGFE